MIKLLAIFLITVLSTSICIGQKALNKEILPYVQFLQAANNYTAKEYILSLWDKYDIVIFCERFHGEATQYDLLMDVVKDERFIIEVGNIFTEVGTISIQKDLNLFLQTNYLNEEQRKADLLSIYRNLTHSHYWGKYNFFRFLMEINKLNSKLHDSLSIIIYPLSWEFPGWDSFETSTAYINWFNKQHNFDSVLAVNFIEQYNKILKNNSRKKALIILNSRHAFGKDMKNEMLEKSIHIPNTARFIFEKYEGKVANILLNTLTLLPVDNPDRGDPHIPVQDGKWDAAFKYTNIKSMGFDINNSPFGEDLFDLWPYSSTNYRYKDIFTGYVFYLPLNEHYKLFGVPGIVSKSFEIELRRRIEIIHEVWNWDKQGQKSTINKEIRQLNKLEKERYRNLRKKLKTIDKWLD